MSAQTSEFQQDEELDAFLTTLSGSDVKSALFYKYPYNANISSIFRTQLRKARQFELIFGTRLHYTKIDKEDILLRPYEIHQGSEPDIMPLLNNLEVIQTAHSKDLYTKLTELKDVWRGFENRFKTPFPARWLMCINQDHACEYWITQYHRDFPSVQGTIRQDVESIIRQIHELNWPKALGNFNLKASAIAPGSFFFPEVTTMFKRYIQNLFGAVVEFEDVINGTIESDEVIVLDAFNVTMLSNLAHLTKRYKIKIVAPDFLYYIHQPFLKYYIAKHQVDPTLLGARSIIDSTFARADADWSQQRRHVLTGIRTTLRKYHKSVGVEDDGEFAIDEDVEPDGFSDFVSDPMLEHEVVTLVNDRQTTRSPDLNERILISTLSANEYSLLPSTKVLMQERGFLLNATASVLEAKMLFVPVTQVTKNIDAESLAVKLSTMPPDALKWKALLKGRCKSVDQSFSILKKQGLTVSVETFSNEWQRADEYEAKGEFHLPRSYKDWVIVCQYLNIEETDRAWDCRKGRAHQNALKRAFVEVIKFLNEEGAYGVNLDDYVLERIASIYEKETGQSSTDGLDRISHARSVVKSISKNFILEEINTVKTLNYG